MKHVLLVIVCTCAAVADEAEDRALRYLAVEVPAWARDNGCYSCHNNGDGARALYVAIQRKRTVAGAAMADTTRWLANPSKWDENKANPAFSDKKLARIQFAAALTEAYEAGLATNRDALMQAAESMASLQDAEGGWQIEAEAGTGSPVTYGSVLATHMARHTLLKADPKRFGTRIEKADGWLRTVRPANLLDTAAVLLALPGDAAIRKASAARLLGAQTSDGGWGPQPHAPPEAFDTAVVLLALSGLRDAALQPAIARGRAFLVKTQLPSGGWPETTRPPGSQSYAQHVSTSAWAALALMATHAER